MLTSSTPEVEIFEQIHSLLEQQRQPNRRARPVETAQARRLETRSGPRRAYHCAQLLAPLKANHPPSQTDFQLVQCRDISPSGFAYVTEVRPTHERLVVALGLAPFSFFVAEIVRLDKADDTGSGKLLVGCRFLHRLGDWRT